MFHNVQSMTPNQMQRKILELVHERRVVEHVYENGEDIPSTTPCSEPLLRLVHGLPGSGKTQVLRWLQSYFEEVWGWTLGLEFVFTAPMNSMASNIQGSTIHSWGQIAFKDRRGTLVNSQQKSKDSRGLSQGAKPVPTVIFVSAEDCLCLPLLRTNQIKVLHHVGTVNATA